MDVTVKFFAAYRTVVGRPETTVELPPRATLQALVSRVFEAYPGLRSHRDSMILAVNQEFADPGLELREGDEVAFLPPVSGGAGLCRIQSEPIESGELVALVRDEQAGAIVVFLGTVRADPGVGALDYEAYEPMAVRKMEALRTAVKGTFGITEIALVHRTGRLPVGETSVAIAISAPHRAEAFRAAMWVMDELKKIVPIWKTER